MNLWPFSKSNALPAPVKKRVAKQPHQISFRKFYSGVVDRLTNSFKGVDLSINESLKVSLDKMRYRCRELIHDNDYAKKYINMVKTNVVGPNGIRLQAQSLGNDGKPDKTDNDAIEKAWKDFGLAENCSVTGNLSMLDTEHVTIASVASDGECIVRFVRGVGYKYGFALQLIEADRIDTQLNKDATVDANRITMSIEFDQFDKPLAYYILTEHPSETVYTFGNKKYMRVPATDILHLFKSERIGQARGIPWMHTSIRRLNMLGGYEEAELVAARAGASKMGFYYTETGEEYTGDGSQSDGSLITEAEPGSFEQLPDNIRFESYDPQHPTGAFNYFVKAVLQGAAVGLNVSYTGFTGDLTAVNFSSIRTGLIEERENWKTLQGWYSQHFMTRVYNEWLSAALTRGLIINDKGVKLPLSKKVKFQKIKWQPRGFAWVDPLKDQQANELAVANGHMTNADVLSLQGKDLEETYIQLQYERELQAKYNLDFTGAIKGKEDDKEKEDNKDDEIEDKPGKT